MSKLEDLKKKFIVGDDAIKDQMESLIEKVVDHCVVHENGSVILKSSKGCAKEKIKLALSARLIASRLRPTIKAGMNGEELATSTGLPKNQVQARVKDIIDVDKFATSQNGIYTANAFKAQQYVESLSS